MFARGKEEVVACVHIHRMAMVTSNVERRGNDDESRERHDDEEGVGVESEEVVKLKL